MRKMLRFESGPDPSERARAPQKPVLAVERRLFAERRMAWIAEGRVGQFVVVTKRRLVGFFPSEDAAFWAGTVAVPGRPFLLRRIALDEKPIIVGGMLLA